MLKRVVIENYRSCFRTTIDLHPHLSVLIGPNSSGKTNILQAIMLLNRLTAFDPFRKRVAAFTLTSRVKARFQEGASQIDLKTKIDSYPDEANNDIITDSTEKWSVKSRNGQTASFHAPLILATQLGGQTTEYTLHYYTGRLHMGRLHMGRSTAIDEIPQWTVPKLASVGHYCVGIIYYGASQFSNPSACPSSFQVEQERERRNLFRARGHTKFLYNMYSAWKDGPSQKYQQFLEIVGPRGLKLIDAITFKEVPTSSVDYSVRVGGKIEMRKRHRLLVVPQFRIGSQRLSPNQLSEGTFKTLALLFHIFTENSTALLIEEPEVGVHHGLLSSILELIKSASRHKQMILSTHSDHVLDKVSPDNVYRVSFDRGVGTTVRHIPRSMTRKEMTALREYLEREGNLGDYWREGGLGEQV
jgi:putative AbiEii toxin of type IV toxin-antitoxin system/AAA ATPase-like protein